MKIKLLAGCTLLLISFFGLELNGQDKSINSYLIKQIKSKKGFYVIYATKDDVLYKIVSKKEKPKTRKCINIVVGEFSSLELHSNIPVIDGVKMLPVNYLDFKGIFTPGQSVYSIEPKKGIFDTFYAENLKGLCIIQ